MKSERPILLTGLVVFSLGVWMATCVLVSLYLVFPYLDIFWGPNIASIDDWLSTFSNAITGGITANPYLLFTGVVLLFPLVILILSYISHALNPGATTKAFDSICWALKSVFRYRLILFVFFSVSLVLLHLEFTSEVSTFINSATILFSFLLPFILVQDRVISKSDKPDLFVPPAWPGWSVTITFVSLAVAGVFLGILGAYFSHTTTTVNFVYSVVSYFLTEAITILQVWILLTKSDLKTSFHNFAQLFALRFLGGWLFLAFLNFLLLLFVLAPVSCVGVLTTFNLPAIQLEAQQSDSIVHAPWQYLALLSNNGSQVGAFILLPLAVITWLAVGRYVWLSLLDAPRPVEDVQKL